MRARRKKCHQNPLWQLTQGRVFAIIEKLQNQIQLEEYSSGRRGVTRNLVGRGTGARVQIPSPPPVIHRDAFRIGVDFLSLSTLFDSREVLLWIFPSAGPPHPPHRTGVTPAPPGAAPTPRQGGSASRPPKSHAPAVSSRIRNKHLTQLQLCIMIAVESTKAGAFQTHSTKEA